MIEMTARDFAAFLREWETPLRRDLATAKSMGQTEHEGNQRLSAKLGVAEERIAELEKLERERVALFERKDAHISKQAERIAELERQTNQYDQALKDEVALQSALKLQVASLERNLQAARAEVSKEREASRVLAEERDAARATLQHAYAEGFWHGRVSMGDTEPQGTMPCATCGRDVREWVGSGCESCDPTLHPSWPGAEAGA